MKKKIILLKKKILVISFFLITIGLSAQVGIGTNSPDPSAVLEMQTTDQAFMPPRMTTGDREQINLPAKGLIIYNLTEHCLQYNFGTPTAPEWDCLQTYSCKPITSVTVQQSGNGYYIVGNSLTLTAVTSPFDASTPITYEWFKDGVSLGAASTNSTYTIPSLAMGDAGNYTVTVSNGCTTNRTSAASTVSVAAACIPITSLTVTQNGSGTYREGGTLILTATVTPSNATAPVVYEWFVKGVSQGVTTLNTFTIDSLIASDAGAYYVRVYNTCTSTITSSTITISVQAGCVSIISTRITQSGNGTYTVGGSVTFTATVEPGSATTPDTYEWFRNGTLVNTTTNNTYTINSLNATHAGSYTVRATNECSNATSTAITVAVCTPITGVTLTQSGSGTYTVGGNVTFTATVTPTDATNTPVTYYWYRGTTLVSTTTNNTLTINPLNSTHAGSYTVRVTNTCSSTITSNAQTVAICTPITSVTLSGGGTYPTGGSLTLTASINPSAAASTATYQWYRGATLISTTTTNTLPLNSLTSTNAGSYTVRVTNSCSGTITSNTQTVVICIRVTGASITSGGGNYAVGGTLVMTASHTPSNASATVTYTWFRGSTQVGTGATLTIPNLTASHTGTYTVRASNTCASSSATSTGVAVTVQTPAQQCTAASGVYVANSRYARTNGSTSDDLGNSTIANSINFYNTTSSGGLCVKTAVAYNNSPTAIATYCQTTYGSGWRLGNVKEVRELMQKGYATSTFYNSSAWRYWSNTSVVSSGNQQRIYLLGVPSNGIPSIQGVAYPGAGNGQAIKCVREM